MDAVIKLKTLTLGNKDIAALSREFEDIKYKLASELTSKMRNLFFVASLTNEVAGVFLSLHGIDFEDWDFPKLVSTVLPLTEKQQQQPSNAASPTSHGKFLNNGRTDFAQVLSSLAAVDLPDGKSYKPADVAALKATLKIERNPDAEKLKTFLSKHGLCFICRSNSHISNDCPNKSDRSGNN